LAAFNVSTRVLLAVGGTDVVLAAGVGGPDVGLAAAVGAAVGAVGGAAVGVNGTGA